MSVVDVLPLGYGAFLLTNEVEGIVEEEGNGAKRLKQEASERGVLVDVRRGHKGRALVTTSRSGRVYWSAVSAATLAERLQGSRRRTGESPCLP
ncbi:extracellular matrix/biofilm biosynthesis regulator RemA family protein [Myxococcota bacterium]